MLAIFPYMFHVTRSYGLGLVEREELRSNMGGAGGGASAYVHAEGDIRWDAQAMTAKPPMVRKNIEGSLL